MPVSRFVNALFRFVEELCCPIKMNLGCQGFNLSEALLLPVHGEGQPGSTCPTLTPVAFPCCAVIHEEAAVLCPLCVDICLDRIKNPNTHRYLLWACEHFTTNNFRKERNIMPIWRLKSSSGLQWYFLSKTWPWHSPPIFTVGRCNSQGKGHLLSVSGLSSSYKHVDLKLNLCHLPTLYSQLRIKN